MGSGRRLIAVATKEAREILRDPITLGIAIVLPLVMLFLFSYAISLEVKAIALAVVDEDGSPESRVYVARFLRSGYFRLRAAPQQVRQVETLLDRGVVRVVLIIPADFARELHQGLATEVQPLVDGAFPNTAILALTYIDTITQAYELEL